MMTRTCEFNSWSRSLLTITGPPWTSRRIRSNEYGEPLLYPAIPQMPSASGGGLDQEGRCPDLQVPQPDRERPILDLGGVLHRFVVEGGTPDEVAERLEQGNELRQPER